MLLRGAVDAIVRGCPAVVIPGYSRMVVLIRDYQAFLAEHTRLTVDVCSNGPAQGIDAISHEGAGIVGLFGRLDSPKARREQTARLPGRADSPAV